MCAECWGNVLGRVPESGTAIRPVVAEKTGILRRYPPTAKMEVLNCIHQVAAPIGVA